uniref:Cse1 domain-containing protein n=1 Tax=Gongylonema pulchrum TaxID=637853 RepID=A0A183DT68_9BILA
LAVESFRSICVQDRKVHSVIVELFGAVAATSGSVFDSKISLLAHYALTLPCVVVRHLPLISACMTSICQLPARLLRSSSYQSLLIFVAKLMIDLAPHSFNEDDRLQTILQSFFSLFENVGHGRTWMPLAQVLQNVCATYLEQNPKAAAPYFLTQTEAIKQLCACVESPAAKMLSDAIARLSRKMII